MAWIQFPENGSHDPALRSPPSALRSPQLPTRERRGKMSGRILERILESMCGKRTLPGPISAEHSPRQILIMKQHSPLNIQMSSLLLTFLWGNTDHDWGHDWGHDWYVIHRHRPLSFTSKPDYIQSTQLAAPTAPPIPSQGIPTPRVPRRIPQRISASGPCRCGPGDAAAIYRGSARNPSPIHGHSG